jgi:hypothetical protein
MKNVLFVVCIMVSLLFFSCGSGGGGGDTQGGIDANSTNVVINLGHRSMDGNTLSTQAIPSSISYIVIRISAPDMVTIERTVDVSGLSEIVVEMEVPNGPNRHIEIFAFNADDVLEYHGDNYTNCEGAAVTVTINMVSVEDTEPPLFDGLEIAEALSENSVGLSWKEAEDTVTPSSAIVYLIYIGLESGGQDFELPGAITAGGSTEHTLAVLSPLTTYYIVVRAKDEAGNVDGNLVEKEVTTMASPDITPPIFGGLINATATSTTAIELAWNAAEDDTTPASDMEYLIFQSTSSGSYDFMNPTYVVPAASISTLVTGNTTGLSYTVSGLNPCTDYFFVVRARDGAGNTDDNAEEFSTTTECINFTLTVIRAGTGSGSITSSPAGIDCGDDCSEVYEEGTTVNLQVAADAGSTFDGWSGDADCADGVVIMDAGRNCTATFILEQHTLTVVNAGLGSGSVTSSPAGINCGGDCSEDYGYGTTVTLTAIPDTGSVFSGWSGNADCADGVVTMDTGRACIATFDPEQHTLTVVKTGTGTGTVTSNPGGVNCGGDCSEDYNNGTTVTLNAVPAGGSTFDGWSGDADCADGVVVMNADRSCTATFTLNPTLTSIKTGAGLGFVTSDPAGINCGSGNSDCSETYVTGTVVTLTATPILDSIFNGWSGDPDCSDGIVTMNANTLCYADFTIPQDFTLTVEMPGEWGDVTSDPPGIDCGNEDCDEVYPQGTVVTLTAIPGQGDYFDGWGGDADCSDGIVTMNSDITCTATFIQVCIPTLITPVNGETNMDNGCQFAPDSVVWDFDWSDCTGASQYNLYVVHPPLNPSIDESGILSSSYHYDSICVCVPWKMGYGETGLKRERLMLNLRTLIVLSFRGSVFFSVLLLPRHLYGKKSVIRI